MAHNPFATLDQPTVVGTLRATGSRDPDVLLTQKRHLLEVARFPKLLGTFLVVLGCLTSLTGIGAWLGIPMVVVGLWALRKGSQNLQAVERGFMHYVRRHG